MRGSCCAPLDCWLESPGVDDGVIEGRGMPLGVAEGMEFGLPGIVGVGILPLFCPAEPLDGV